MKCIVVMPIYDDWQSLQRLLPELDQELARMPATAHLVLVDDGSPAVPFAELGRLELRAITELSVIRLRCNLGHQRAIATGLSHVEAALGGDFVVVMDGDGEDRPTDVPRLLEAAVSNAGERIVFAERVRRSEGAIFFVLYALFKAVHLLLTGVHVRVGNFSVIPRRLVSRLVASSDLWNHYAAAVFKSRLAYAMVPTTRGRRYAGRTHMNFVALAAHGLSAMATFADRIGVRLIVATLAAAGAVVAASLAAVLLDAADVITIPEWGPLLLGLLVIMLFQGFAVSLTFVIIMLASRQGTTFLPFRDYAACVLEVVRIDPIGRRERTRGATSSPARQVEPSTEIVT
jgi:hypothetical protein